eukprot:gene27239-2493_t
MPVLHRQVLVNETTAGVRFFGPVPITNPVTNYTTFNVSLPVTDSNSKSNLVSMCNTLMTNMSAHKIAMNTTMLRLLVDQRNGADKRFLKVQSNLLMDAIAALLPELLTPIFVSPLGELPLSDPHSASLTALQALYEPGITFATQPGSATLNLARPNVISVSLQGFPSMSLLADARLAEMAFQEGEVNSTTIQAPAFADSYPVLTVKEILDLYESAGATSGILPHPSSTSMGVLATDYNLATWDGNTTAYTDCDLAVRAPEYLGSCTSKNVTCNVSSDASSQPFNCTQLPGGETVVGDLSVASNRTVCEQPCEMELDCAALCNCFDSCSSAEAGQSPSQISGLQTTSAGRRQLSSSGSRRNLLQINLQDELDNAANQVSSSEVKNVQDGLSTELVTMDSDVRASNVESVRLARDDTMAALIKASQRDLNLGQATVISRLDEIIDQQALENQQSRKDLASYRGAVRLHWQRQGQALALWKRGKRRFTPGFLDSTRRQEAAGMVKYLKEGNATLSFDFSGGGSVKLHHKLQTVRVDLYHFSKDTVRFILEIGTSGMVVCMLMWSLLTLVTTCAKQGFSTWFTARNVFSLSCDLLTVSTMVYWWIIVYLYANMYNIDLRYDVYNNIGPYARALELANGGRGIEDVSAAFSELESLSDHFAWYISLNSISILLLIARLHILIAFQAQLGLISRTLVAAASDLAHFVGVALVILFLLAAMAHVVFGASMDAFNSMDYSIRTCFEMLLGNTDANAELQDENSPLYRIGAIFFWVFNLLVVLVLVSFLIAIICDAFAKVQAQDDDNTSIFTDLRMILSDNWRALRSMLSSGRRIKEAELVQFLSEMCDLGDPKQHDDLASSRRSSRMSSYSGVVKNKVVPAPPLVSVAVAEQDENAVIAFVEPAATFPKQQNTAGVVARVGGKDVVPFLTGAAAGLATRRRIGTQVVMELSQEQLLRELKKAMDLVLKGQASQTSSPGSHTIWGGNKARRSNKDKDKDKGALSGYFSGRLSSSSNAPSEEEGGHAPIDQSQDPSVVARTLLERWGAKRGDGSKDEETWEEPNHELLTFLNGEGRREQRALEEECKVLEAALMTLYASQRQLYDGQKELVESQLKVHEQQSLLRHLAPVDVAPRKNRPLDKGKTSVPIPTLEPKVPGSAGSRLGSPGKSMPMPDRLSVSGGGSSP